MNPFVSALIGAGLGIVKTALVVGCAGSVACGLALLARRNGREGVTCLALAAAAGVALYALWGASAGVGP